MKSNTAKKMMEWQQQSAANKQETILGAMIGWRATGDDKGRGVFALRDIKKGEVIEIAPVVTVSKANVAENGEAPDGYLLQWDEETEGEEYCMPLGYIMLYNHRDEPTLELENDMDEYTITAKAARNIKAGEELTWNYSCELWFEAE
jgi:SET domain-containing protein